MATFTRKSWETGDTITAEGLNGGKGYLYLELSKETDLDESNNWDFDITIPTGLTVNDFIGMRVKAPDVWSDSGYTIDVAMDATLMETGAIAPGFRTQINMFYYPETGQLTTEMPI